MRQQPESNRPLDLLLLRLELVIEHHFPLAALLGGTIQSVAEQIAVDLEQLFGHILRLPLLFGRSSPGSARSLSLLALGPHGRLDLRIK